MTHINPKLTAALATIAILAPAAGAQAATYRTSQPARYLASTRSECSTTTHHARRSTATLRRYHSGW
jgi:hypothetical protein